MRKIVSAVAEVCDRSVENRAAPASLKEPASRGRLASIIACGFCDLSLNSLLSPCSASYYPALIVRAHPAHRLQIRGMTKGIAFLSNVTWYSHWRRVL